MMAMNAAAINHLPKQIFADMLKKDILNVIDTNYVIIPKELYDHLMNLYTDREIELEAEKRLAALGEKIFTEQEIMKMFGITEHDVAAVGDVEIE